MSDVTTIIFSEITVTLEPIDRQLDHSYNTVTLELIDTKNAFALEGFYLQVRPQPGTIISTDETVDMLRARVNERC